MTRDNSNRSSGIDTGFYFDIVIVVSGHNSRREYTTEVLLTCFEVLRWNELRTFLTWCEIH